MVCTFLLSLFVGMPALEVPHSSSKAALHVPHDDVHSVATADLSSGERESIITTQLACRVLKTRDGGLSWQTVRGGGLELARADFAVWDPYLNGGRFLIGSNIGVFSYDPISSQVVEYNAGLTTGDFRYVTSLEVAGYGVDGPVIMATKKGEVFRLNRSSETWESVLNTGDIDPRAQVSIYPGYDKTAAPGASQAVAAGVAGVLYQSEDGGTTWSVNGQFDTPAVVPADPLITAICFAEDYPTTGNMMVATSVENLNNFTGDEGILWQSANFGTSFNGVHQADSSYRAIKSTPPAPSGKRWMLASVLEHPDFRKLGSAIGVLRSEDGGLTWDDYGTAQDFIHELDASDTVSLRRAEILDFELSPTFSTDGEILFGRSEGLFRTVDEGLHWKRIAFRPVTHVRGLDSFIGSQGHLWAVAGTYGSGTVIQNMSNGQHFLLDGGPMVYQDEVFVSPNFAEDGTMMVGGAQGLNLWYDPELHAPNPHNAWGWYTKKKSATLGYARYLAFSPNFDARGTPGSDQTIFFSTSTSAKSTFRSADGGLTGEMLDKLGDGSDAPWLRNLLVAPTYDPSSAATRTDVYGSSDKLIFRLKDNRWHLVGQVPAYIETMCLPPNFDRQSGTPGRAVVMIGLSKYPYFGVVEDALGNADVTFFPDGLEESAVIKLLCAPNFETNPVVYAATYTSGVKKLDLSAVTPVWEQVGGDFPEYFVDGLSLSPDFANDQTILVGTQAGVVVGTDAPGAPWVLRPSRYSRDNEAPAFRYYSPNHPQNPQPDRVWRWGSVPTYDLRGTPDLVLRDSTVAMATMDGDYVEFTDYAASILVKSFKGPEAGEMEIVIENALTGAAIHTQTFDLMAPKWSSQSVQFYFPYQPVAVKVTAHLDPNELFYFDGATFVPF
jgi:photosystem II stability/assembly factor-like uncharacterized protein